MCLHVETRATDKAAHRYCAVVVVVAVVVVLVVVVGCWLLVVGCWLLVVVVGCWLLVVVGCWLFLVVGCCWLLVVVGCCWLLVVVGCWLLLETNLFEKQFFVCFFVFLAETNLSKLLFPCEETFVFHSSCRAGSLSRNRPRHTQLQAASPRPPASPHPAAPHPASPHPASPSPHATPSGFATPTGIAASGSATSGIATSGLAAVHRRRRRPRRIPASPHPASPRHTQLQAASPRPPASPHPAAPHPASPHPASPQSGLATVHRHRLLRHRRIRPRHARTGLATHIFRRLRPSPASPHTSLFVVRCWFCFACCCCCRCRCTLFPKKGLIWVAKYVLCCRRTLRLFPSLQCEEWHSAQMSWSWQPMSCNGKAAAAHTARLAFCANCAIRALCRLAGGGCFPAASSRMCLCSPTTTVL